MLQNLINALSGPTIFEHRSLEIYSHLTHALKILYFGIHLVDQEGTLQYQDQFIALFRALTQVVYQSTKDSTSAQDHEIAGTGSSTINQDHLLVRFICDSSTELKAAVNTVTKACLEHIQRQDIMAIHARQKYDLALEQGAWSLLFKPQETVFEDSFVEWLLVLYMASSSHEEQNDLDKEINHRFYRIRQLGFVEKVREKYPML